MQGAGTDDPRFWLITDTQDLDHEAVKKEYKAYYGSLEADIRGDFSGADERRALESWGFPVEESSEAIDSYSSRTTNDLIRLATHLDSKGLIKEANYLDALIKESASAGGAAAAAGAGAVYSAGGLMAALPGAAALPYAAAGAAAGIFAYLIGTEVLTPAAKAVWDRFPENTKTALQQVAAAVRAVPAGIAEDLKAGLRGALEKALELLGPEQQAQASAESTDSVIKLANYLDEKGFAKEANYLDSLIKKTAGSYVSVGGSNPDDVLSTEEIGKLYDLGWRGNDFADVDRSTSSVREALGLGSPGGSARENRPLTSAEFASLFKGHEDPSSNYKLTSDRISEIDMNYSNLTDEEAEMADASGGLVGTASKFINNLITLSTHLDENGLIKEANYLDSLLRKTAGFQPK